MWNRAKAARLVGIVNKEYGKEIITEGSKSVKGLEDHIDRMKEEILGIESDIVTVSREWRKVLERAAMTEGIDRVKSILGQENKDTIAKKDEIVTQESKTDIEMVDQTVTINSEDNLEVQVSIGKDQLIASKKSKTEYSSMEDIEETQEKEVNSTNPDHFVDSTEESEEEILLADSDSSLERSIWAPNKDCCRRKGNIRAKVAAIKVLRNNLNHREKLLRWSMERNIHLKEISEKFE